MKMENKNKATLKNVSGIIVIDGADGSGKSSLAKYFIDVYGARYLHCGLRKDVFMHHLGVLHLAERWASRGELVVIDRLWLSELAYGDSLRKGAKHPIGARCFDRLLLRMAAVQVICIQEDFKAHLQRFIELKKVRQEEFNEDQVAEVIEYFRWLAGYAEEKELNIAPTNYANTFRENLNERPDVWVLEFEDACKDLAGHADLIIGTLGAVRRDQTPLALSDQSQNVTGHTALAKYLLVGEKTSHSALFGLRYPFIGRDDQLNASLWLNRALDNLNIPEHHLVMTNALDQFGKMSIELETLANDSLHKWQKIMALGRVAASQLHLLGLKEDRDFVTVPHPQWARRFRYRDHQWFTNTLGEALGVNE